MCVPVLPPPVLRVFRMCRALEVNTRAQVWRFWCTKQNTTVVGVTWVFSPVSMAWAPLAHRCVDSWPASEQESIKAATGSWPSGFKRDESIIWLNFACSVSFLCAASSHLVDVRERRKHWMCCTSLKHLLYHFWSYLCQPSECVSLASNPCDST